MKKLTLIIAILLSGQITAKTIIVDLDGSGDYTTIQAGIDATAAAGDTVLVLPGVYIEGVTINRGGFAIYLIGSGAEVTTIFFAGRALHTAGDASHTISGFNIVSTQANTIELNAFSTLKNCIVEGIGNRQDSGSSSYPAILCNGQDIKILNTVIKNSGHGIKANNGTTVVTNCIFYDTYYAAESFGGTLTIQNSIFVNNSTATYKNSGYLSTLYSCFYENSTNYSGTSEGIGDIAADPKFVDISKSFALQSDSPARDTGNPSNTYNDGDGSRNDMGVYGGPNSWGKGPVITDIAITPATVNQGGSVTITATAKKN